MAQKTTVAVRFTKLLVEERMQGFVNQLGHLIVYNLKKNRPGKTVDKDFKIQWFRLPDEEQIFAVIIWGTHETVEVRRVISDVAKECDKQQLSVVLDIVPE